ncbi:DarT ssDNA thymidine ADP-ribosyltransferase family protein [Agromyces sp. NPDC055661]
MERGSRSIVAQTQPCNHGIDIDACLFCAEFAAAQVWLSDAEEHFHNRPDCESRVHSEIRGTYSKDPDWRRRIEFAKAEREGARPCPVCRPYDPRRWRRKQATSEYIGELRLTHFTRFENLLSIVEDREILARNRLDRAPGLGSESSVAARAATVVRRPDVSVQHFVPFSLTHRPSFMDSVRTVAEDERLLSPSRRPRTENLVALETTFYRVTHRDADAAPEFRLRWAITSRDAGDPSASIRDQRSDLAALIDIARREAGERFTDHPITKNAEFLVENGVPFRLIDRILVPSVALKNAMTHVLETKGIATPPDVRVRAHWFDRAP